MNDLERFKAIQRAVKGVPMEEIAISRAVDKVREIVAPPAPDTPATSPEPATDVRRRARGRDRLERNAPDRSGPSASGSSSSEE